MKYQAVIFDLDGTLLDTLTDLWNAVNAACKKYGCAPRTRLQVRRALGNGLNGCCGSPYPKIWRRTVSKRLSSFFGDII